MNRIILIGNGFDLAHSLKTSYKDFITRFWEEKATKIKNNAGRKFEDDNIIIEKGLGSWHFQNGNTDYQDLLYNLKETGLKIIFKNKFLKTVTQKISLQNWVDIEEEYYHALKQCLQSEKDDTEIVRKLNADLDEIKKLLEDYLKHIRQNEVNAIDSIYSSIYDILKLKDFTFEGFSSIIEEEYQEFIKIEEQIKTGKKPEYYQPFSKIKDWTDDINNKIVNKDNFKAYFTDKLNMHDNLYRDLLPKKTLFLNFNYTQILNKYLRPMQEYDDNTEVIHIHGELCNTKNPIIFGYGDEIDQTYKEMENRNNNDYLENVKSIKYSDTDNHKRMMNFINSDNFQIFIMGHSCGISDRTLLNTLFEHENCVSIKLFYHKKTDGTDNYSDIIKNISRNFTKKAVMRNKVVNKDYCQPLGQKN